MDFLRRRVSKKDVLPKTSPELSRRPCANNHNHHHRDEESHGRHYPAVHELLCHWKIFATQFGASMLVHAQGLRYLYQYHGSPGILLLALAGAGLEGVFVSSLVVYGWFWERRKQQPSTKATRWASAGCALLLITACLSCLLSDALFQQKTEGALPDMWVVLSGLKEGGSLLQGEAADDPGQLVITVLWAFGSAGLAAVLVAKAIGRVQSHKISETDHDNDNDAGVPLLLPDKDHSEPHHKPSVTKPSARAYFGILFGGMAILYASGAWMPVFHVGASICGSFVFTPPGWSASLTQSLTVRDIEKADPNAPNVVLIMHESLSGELLLNNNGTYKVPFLQNMARATDNATDPFFVFENVRSVSGQTTDCLTAIQSGCTPLDHKRGFDYALNTTIATQFKKKGYETVSFSSRLINNFEGTKWFMLFNQLAMNFDRVFHPEKSEDPLVNGPARNDILTAEHFDSWLADRPKRRRRKDHEKPFYAQLYYFNSHYPFYNDETVSGTTDRIPGMFATVESSIERIFKSLEKAGKLENTVVMGMGDHGENVRPRTKETRGRMHEWNANILHPLMYLHVPPRILHQNPGLSEILRHNAKQLVSILDAYPTLRHISEGKAPEHAPVTDRHCVRGLDLWGAKIPDDRVAWSIPGVGIDTRSIRWGNMALHSGTTSTLMNRFGYPRGPNALSVVRYGTNLLAAPPASESPPKSIEDIDEWNQILRNLKGKPDEAVLKANSRYAKKFVETLAKYSG